MKNNCIKILEMDKKRIAPFQQLWLRLGVNELLTMKMSEWFKLVEICMVQILGFVEDEWCSNTLPFMKKRCVID